MVASKEQAGEAYRIGITTFGVDNYRTCGDKSGSGFLAVAQCLHDAKKRALTAENMVAKYKAKA
ncbi:MAG: hypothetical protein Q8J68_07825 [Methanolobus sp.]|uniref:hypothetical protein n=1 Tax=Methanolobus sp. TaxID=1874737 RepID=UPI00272F470C|nr:hypothetical protein [Methanolobus sp.]MDP2217176.1 hypothetical protein [Methanolobus sp.]